MTQVIIESEHNSRRSVISFREFAEEEGGVISISTVPRFKICVPHALVVKYIVHTQTHEQAVNGETAQRPCRWKLRLAPSAFRIEPPPSSGVRLTFFRDPSSEVCRRGCTGESTSTAKRALRRGTRATSADVVNSYRAGGRPNCEKKRSERNKLLLDVCSVERYGTVYMTVSPGSRH